MAQKQPVLIGRSGSRFVTPLWHWTLPWRKAGFLPDRSRRLVDRATHLLRYKVALPRGLSLCPTTSWQRLSSSQHAEQDRRWKAVLSKGYGPAAAWSSLGHALVGPWALRIHLDSEAHVSYWLLIQDSASKPLAYARRQIDLTAKQARHDLLAVVSSAQASGIGAQILANAYAAYRTIGLTQISLTAGLNAGGAVWPKFGFRPVDDDAWEAVKSTVEANLKQMPVDAFDAFAKIEGRSLNAAVQEVIRIPSPDGIWDLVDIDPGGRAGKLAKLAHGIAGALLQGSRWPGVLDLTDQVAEARFRDYIESKARKAQVLLPPSW